MSKIAIIGDKTSILGFRALGLDIFAFSNGADGPAIWQQIISQDYAAVFVTEPAYESMKDLFAEVSGKIAPAVTIIPATTGSTGMAMAKIKRVIEKAVGADILSKSEE